MNSIIPGRYAEPKWQAYLTPETKAFIFSSGRKIKSLFDLKVALTEESEEVIANLLKDGNALANWVEQTILDADLAKEMRKYQHRWGLIVALERHMMRELSLPNYVAKRWLLKTDIGFTFASSQVVKSLIELKDVLAEVSEETIAFHRERVPNDISKWIMDIIGDYLLAELLEEATNKAQMWHFVEDHLKMLNDAADSA